MFDILFTYDFQTVAFGTVILAIASAMIGCFSLHKGQSLVGDAIGHSAYPGVVIAFMIFLTRNPLVLLFGAAFMGALAYMSINGIVKYSTIKLDAALAIVLSSFFGLGNVLKSFTQGNPNYANASQAGLKNYIFGSAAFILKEDVYIILAFSLLALSLMVIFYKELVISIFDPSYAKSIGIKSVLIDNVLLAMMIIIISLGLKSVGAILISSFLVIPCVCANQITKKLKPLLIISAIVGACSSFIGTYLSITISGFSTGPTIIVCMCIFTMLSMLFAKYGLIRSIYIKRKLRQ